jgi:hypothetical protein
MPVPGAQIIQFGRLRRPAIDCSCPWVTDLRPAAVPPALPGGQGSWVLRRRGWAGMYAAQISVRWRRDSPGAQGGLGAVGGLQLVEDA